MQPASRPCRHTASPPPRAGGPIRRQILPIVAAFATAFSLALPLPAAAQSLQQALAEAYTNNPQLLTARAQLRVVDENVPTALSGWRPTVTLQGSAGYFAPGSRVRSLQSVNGRVYGVTTDQERDTMSGAAVLSQPLYSGGRTQAATRRAENQVFGQRARLLATEQQVLSDVVNAFVQVIRYQEELQLNINNTQVLAEQLQATNERFRVGEITRTDVAQAESRLAGARAARAVAEGNLQSARATYQRLVGSAPAKLEPPQPLQAPISSANAAGQLAAANNPNVVAALFDETAARDGVDVQMAALLPQLSVQTQVFRTDNASQDHVRSTGGQVTANLTVPLYQGGAEYAAVRQARQQVQQARAVVEDQRRQAAQQATQAWDTLAAARAQVTSTRAQIRAAEIALNGVQREALVGSRTTLDVLNAEQELLNARVALVQALTALVGNSYALAASVGRLTAVDLALPVQLYDMNSYYKAVRNRWIGFGNTTGGE